MHESERAAAVPSEENWVYPSPASFYSALQRKDRNPNARDMGIVVPIHNAVNERVWNQVLEWEREAMGLEPGQDPGSKLVSFVGKPKEVSPRARWKTLIGCVGRVLTFCSWRARLSDSPDAPQLHRPL